jgi:protein pelota
MKIIKKRLKAGEGEISLRAESQDDLWHLRHIIEPKDLVRAWTERKVEFATDKLRPEKFKREKVLLGVRAEEIEFHKFSARLRVRGKIEEGMDMGSYHTISVEPFGEISIIKKWNSAQLDRINEAVRASAMPEVMIVTIEEGECIAGALRQWGIEQAFEISMPSGKKDGESKRTNFFHKILEHLRVHSKVDTIIVAGPGFTKEDFLKYAKEKDAALGKKIVLETVRSMGVSGFQEVLRRGAVDKIMKDLRVAREAKLIEVLMEEIAKGGKAAYGFESVEKAAQTGAVETLLVADEKLHSIDDALLKMVEKARGRVVVFSTEFEPGERLRKLGGVAALLKFKVDF